MQIRILGCGGSMGVPVVGCECAVCRSPDLRNVRSRSSALFLGEAKLLIDCGPDFRMQALRAQLSQLDAVLITHAHYDHIGGLDDLRAIELQGTSPVQLVCHQETGAYLEQRYPYLFHPRPQLGRAPLLQLVPLQGEQGSLEIGGQQVDWIRYEQAGTAVLGYRMGDFAYLTDLKEEPVGLACFLQGVRVLVLSALQWAPHAYFLSVQEAVELAQRYAVPTTWLTHMQHSIDATSLAATLPPGVAPAHDQLLIQIP